MSREKGLLPLSANFEVNYAGFLDAKMKTPLKSDLTDSSTFGAFAHKGMIVSVFNDPTVVNNGVYFLKDDDYTNFNNWEKIGDSTDTSKFTYELQSGNTSVHPRWNQSTNAFGQDRFNLNLLPGGSVNASNVASDLGQTSYNWTTSEFNSTSNYYFGIVHVSGVLVNNIHISKLIAMSVRLMRDYTSSDGDKIDGRIVKDIYIDNINNKYDGVIIGNQVWLTSNLKTNKDNTGQDLSLLSSDQVPAYTVYPHVGIFDTQQEMIEAYGMLYNAYSLSVLAEPGWRVPSISDLNTLRSYLYSEYSDINEDNIGDMLKSIRQVNSTFEKPIGLKPKNWYQLDAKYIKGLSTNDNSKWEVDEDRGMENISFENNGEINNDEGLSIYISSPSVEDENPFPVLISIPIELSVDKIESLVLSYSVSATNSAYISEQKSYIKCTNIGGTSETELTSGVGDYEGDYTYTRNIVDLIQGVQNNTDTLTFEIHLFRTWNGGGNHISKIISNLINYSISSSNFDYKYIKPKDHKKISISNIEDLDVKWENKESANTSVHPRWNDSNRSNVFGIDKFNLNILPSGARYGFYHSICSEASIITSTINTYGNVRRVTLDYLTGNIYYQNTDKIEGLSVRVVRDYTVDDGIKTDGRILPRVFIDYDGNYYDGVIIGDQVWSTKNLHTTTYLNGDTIPTGYNSNDWSNLTTGAYSIYDYNLVEGINSEQEMINAYGILYNWYAIDDSRGLVSNGHVPSEIEFIQLVDYLISTYPNLTVNTVGNSLKSVRQVNSPYEYESETLIRPKDGKKLDASHIVNLPEGQGLTPEQEEVLDNAEAHINGADEAKHTSNQIINVAALPNIGSGENAKLSTILSYIDEKIQSGGEASSVKTGNDYVFQGTLLDEVFPGTTLNSSNWAGGLPTGASINNKLIIASGASDWSRYIQMSKHYLYEKKEMIFEFKPLTKAAGNGWGIRQSNILTVGGSQSIQLFVDLSDGVNSGRVLIGIVGGSETTYGISQPCDFSIGDEMRLRVISYPFRTITILENITTGAKSYGEYNLGKWGTQGYYRLSFLGGQQEFTLIKVDSKVRNYQGNGGVIFLGDSITQGSGAGVVYNRYTDVAMRGQDHLFENLGVSTWVSGTLSNARLTELITGINAKTAIVNMGYNDAQFSIDPTTYQANLEQIAATLQTAGYTVIFVCPFFASVSYRDAMEAAAVAAGVKFIDIQPEILVGGVVNINYLSSDNIHPNELGHEVLGNIIQRECPEIYKDIISDVDKNGIVIQDVPISAGTESVLLIDSQGRVKKSLPNRFVNRNWVLLQSGTNIQQVGSLHLSDTIKNGGTYHQKTATEGLRISFNNEVNNTTGSNIQITNIGSSGSGIGASFRTITGLRNIIIDATSVKSANRGSVAGNDNLFIGCAINASNSTGGGNIGIGSKNAYTSGALNIMIGGSTPNLSTGSNNILISTQGEVNGNLLQVMADAIRVIAIGTCHDTAFTKMTNGEVCIATGVRSTRVYTFGMRATTTTYDTIWRASLNEGENKAAKDLYIQGGVGTGTGALGSIILQTTNIQAAGTTAQIQATRLTVTSGFVRVHEVLKTGQYTGTAAEALTPENGDLLYITATSAVFTSVGFWGYENGAWIKL